ncbi:hypothetical protein Mal64_22810 [Pseudobythopirellula maris]|uniref:Uncharacterized protein n=1 Tax=Pseudobythopirellula maris TaxID=2527991 RepID=A0A5C5ZR58_9BACT|nr:choice-of-anchor Q domain-containing protein [Pseudobythopirellula maris]TWT88793.1 hypothetical protein Mal64_22810 [Pseudobythopirellula maris]
MLAVFTVNNLNDSDVTMAGDLPGSLRQAVFDANQNAGADTIEFGQLFNNAQIIELVGELPQITDDLTITGPGTVPLTLDAGDGLDNKLGTYDGFRHFLIDDRHSENEITVVISGLTLTGGDSSFEGGAILNFERLELTNSTLSGNSAAFSGGGISNRGTGTLTLTSSTLSDNSAGGSGGGIINRGTTALTGSTLSGNSAALSGGGISNRGTGTLTLTSSTLSGNSAGSSGGGINNSGAATITVTSSTLTGNSADTSGGGIYSRGRATVSSSIVANSLSDGDVRLLGPFTINYSLIGDTAGSGLVTSTGVGNLLDQAPLLGQLADNGGPTKTHALLPGSPALNAGDDSVVEPFDQRGTPFVRNYGGGVDIGAFEASLLVVNSKADIDDMDDGNDTTTLREAIRRANDDEQSVDGIAFDLIFFSTHQTILLSSQLPTIARSVVIVGPGQQLLTIDAGYGADNTPATGDGFRHFNIDDGQEGLFRDVTLSGMTLTGGDTARGVGFANPGESGGAIFSRESLTLLSTSVTGNATGDGADGVDMADGGSGGNGGGIYSTGKLTISGSTISGNTTGGGGDGGDSGGGGFGGDGGMGGIGGGINSTGPLTITDSTISGNTTGDGGRGGNGGYGGYGGHGGSGGGVSSTDALLVTGSTIIGNTTGDGGFGGSVYAGAFGGNGGNGGGFFSSSNSMLTISGSIISGNTTGDGGDGGVTYKEVYGGGYGGYGGNGGGFSGSGVLAITGSTISGNTTGAGGYNDDHDRESIGGRGGGIHRPSYSSLAITSSTISENSTTGFSAHGGGIWTKDLTVSIDSSTITANAARGVGGGVNHFSGVFYDNERLTIRNSIVAGNNDSGTAPDLEALNGPANELTVEFSLIGNNLGTMLTAAPVSSPDADGNVIGAVSSVISPRLGPLANNGGPTRTHALLPESPALNAGSSSEAFDQRGFLRNVGGVDIGAYEAQGPVTAASGDYNRNGVVDAADFTVWRDALDTATPVTPLTGADGDGDGFVTRQDYDVWVSHFGFTYTLPTPAFEVSPASPLTPLAEPQPAPERVRAAADEVFALWLAQASVAIEDDQTFEETLAMPSDEDLLLLVLTAAAEDEQEIPEGFSLGNLEDVTDDTADRLELVLSDF